MSSSDYPAYDNGLLQLAKISEIHSKSGGSWSALESSSFSATKKDSSRSTSPSTQSFQIRPPSTPIPNPLTPLPTPDHSNASSASSSPTSADFAENGDRHSFEQAKNGYGSSPPPSPSTSSDSSGSESTDVIINIDLASLDTEDIHSSSDPKPKRKRANDWQLQVLNKVFDQVAFPTANVRKELAQLLGMTPRSVQIWFQNRRQGLRSNNQHVEDPVENKSVANGGPVKRGPRNARNSIMKLNVIGPKCILAKFSKSKSYPSSTYDKPVCRSNKKPSMSLGGATNVKPSYTLVVRSPGSVNTSSCVPTIKPEEQQYNFHTPQPASQLFESPIVSSSFASSPEEPPSTPSSPFYEFRTPLSPSESLPSISSILGDYLTPTHEPTSPPPLSIPLRSPTPSQPLGRPQSPLPQTPSTPIPSRHSSKDAYLRSCPSPVEYAQVDIHNQTSDTELSYTKPKSKLGWSSKRNHSGSSNHQNNSSYHIDYFNYSPFRNYHNQMTCYNDRYGYRSSDNTQTYTNWDTQETTEGDEQSPRNQGTLEEIYFETV